MSKPSPVAKEVERIISVLKAGTRQDMIILIVPSHDKKNKKLNNQEQWAEGAMDLFADLFGGATAFETFAGIYKDWGGNILRDKPILIECYAQRSDLEDVEKLTKLCLWIKKMGADTRQAAVALIVNDVFHEIADF